MEWVDFYQKFHLNCAIITVNFLIVYKMNIYILKNTFEGKFLGDLKSYVIKKFLNQKSEFHKILDDVPNFCRFIDEDLSKNYSFKQIKMTAYFFLLMTIKRHSKFMSIFILGGEL